MFAVQAISFPSENTGMASTRSLRCVTPPCQGSLVMKTSPGWILSCLDRMNFTDLSSTPTKAGIPAPEDASRPSASVMPVPMSSTS